MKKDYDSTKKYRKTQKKGASQTYDTPSLVKANNSIRFYIQHRFRCSLTVLTDKTKVLYSSFSPVATVEGAITDGLCQVVRLYMFAAFQVGNGACYLQDAVVGAGRE